MAEKPLDGPDCSEGSHDGDSSGATGTTTETPEPGGGDMLRPAEPTEDEDTDTSSNTSSSYNASSSAGGSSSMPNASGIVEMANGYFENCGYRVKIHGGNRSFLMSEACKRKCVEMTDGAVFAIELSNLNDYGCDVDIRMLKLHDDLGLIILSEQESLSYYPCEDVGGWRLDARHENFVIHNSGYNQGKFVFYGSDPGNMSDDTNKKNKENMNSVIEIVFTPEGYSLDYRVRHDDSKGVKNIRIPKRSTANLQDLVNKLKEKKKVYEKKKLEREKDFSFGMKAAKDNPEELRRLEEKYKEEESKMVVEIEQEFAGSAGWSFFNGENILHLDVLIQSVVNTQSKKKPWLLLKDKEKISVKLDEGGKKEIEVNPLAFNLEDVTKKVADLFGEGEYKLKVGDEDMSVNNWVKCLMPDSEVKVTRKITNPAEPTTAGEVRACRGIGLMRGLNFRGGEGFGSGSRGFRGGDDDDDEECFGMLRGPGSANNRTRNLPPNIGVVRYEGDPVQAFSLVASDPNAPFITSSDDKVVMIISLVAMSGSS